MQGNKGKICSNIRNVFSAVIDLLRSCEILIWLIYRIVWEWLRSWADWDLGIAQLIEARFLFIAVINATIDGGGRVRDYDKYKGRSWEIV